MEWNDHCTWAKRLDIHPQSADYVNRLVDMSDEADLPEDYLLAIPGIAADVADERGARRGNSALGRVLAEACKSHDAGRRKNTRASLAAECNRRFLRRKGEDYVLAWYLHHHLDYLDERYTSGTAILELLREYSNEHPETSSPRITEFLRQRQAMLRRSLHKDS